MKTMAEQDAKCLVPMEVALQVASYMPLEQVMNHAPYSTTPPQAGVIESMFPSLDASVIRDDRRDVRKYLSQIFVNPARMLEVMLLSDAFISGSRALEFFLPGSAVKGSDWDIFCTGSHRQCLLLADELLKQGMVVGGEDDGGRQKTSEVREQYSNVLAVMCGTINKGGKTHAIQLINCVEDIDLEVVLSFHSSIVMCFISGYAAVSVASPLTSQGKSIKFRDVAKWKQEASDRAVQKYADRGICYINRPAEPSTYGARTFASLHAWDSYVVQLSRLYEDNDMRKLCTMKEGALYQLSWKIKNMALTMNFGDWAEVKSAVNNGGCAAILAKKVNRELVSGDVRPIRCLPEVLNSDTFNIAWNSVKDLSFRDSEERRACLVIYSWIISSTPHESRRKERRFMYPTPAGSIMQFLMSEEQLRCFLAT